MLAKPVEHELFPIEEFLDANDKTFEESKKEDLDEISIETKQRKSKKIIYGKGNEAISIKKDLGDFDAFNSKTYEYIHQKFGRSVRFIELLGIINSIDLYLQIKKKIFLPKLTRNEKRSFPLLIKYIEMNSELILPCFQYISLCDSSFRKIELDIKK